RTACASVPGSTRLSNPRASFPATICVSASFDYTWQNSALVNPYFIAIAGLSGSGKTELARALAGRLAPSALLTLDSYYHPQSHLPLEARAALNYDHPDAIDWRLLLSHLDSLARGESIEEPHYAFELHTRS